MRSRARAPATPARRPVRAESASRSQSPRSTRTPAAWAAQSHVVLRRRDSRRRPARVCRETVRLAGWPLADRDQTIVLSKGNPRRTTASTTEKIAVLAPMPSVSTSIAATEKLGDERRNRKAAFRSFRMAPSPCHRAGRFPTGSSHLQTPPASGPQTEAERLPAAAAAHTSGARPGASIAAPRGRGSVDEVEAIIASDTTLFQVDDDARLFISPVIEDWAIAAEHRDQRRHRPRGRSRSVHPDDAGIVPLRVPPDFRRGVPGSGTARRRDDDGGAPGAHRTSGALALRHGLQPVGPDRRADPASARDGRPDVVSRLRERRPGALFNDNFAEYLSSLPPIAAPLRPSRHC